MEKELNENDSGNSRKSNLPKPSIFSRMNSVDKQGTNSPRVRSNRSITINPDDNFKIERTESPRFFDDLEMAEIRRKDEDKIANYTKIGTKKKRLVARENDLNSIFRGRRDSVQVSDHKDLEITTKLVTQSEAEFLSQVLGRHFIFFF
jgi:hypothetical protein